MSATPWSSRRQPSTWCATRSSSAPPRTWTCAPRPRRCPSTARPRPSASATCPRAGKRFWPTTSWCWPWAARPARSPCRARGCAASTPCTGWRERSASANWSPAAGFHARWWWARASSAWSWPWPWPISGTSRPRWSSSATRFCPASSAAIWPAWRKGRCRTRAWSSAWASRCAPLSPAQRAARPKAGWPAWSRTTPLSKPTWSSWPSGSSPTPPWPARPGSMFPLAAASAWTTACAPATRTSTPGATAWRSST